MGALEQVLAGLDAAKRTVGRNVSDLIADPALYAEKIIGHLRNQNAGVTPTIANGELTNRVLSPSERAQHAMETVDFGGGLGVIKPKGGNWLSGQVEGMLGKLRKPTEPYVHRNAEGWAVAPEYGTPMPEAEAAALRANPIYGQNQALNSWIDGPLTKYIKRDFASPTDPIRKLADQGILHVAPEQLEMREALNGLKARRETLGFPAEGAARTPLGSAWESAADYMLGRDYTKRLREQPEARMPGNEWIQTAPDTDINVLLSKNPNELGLGHLTDELSNSLREGRLRPEQLTSGNLSVEGAVRHVAEINALRAKKAQEAIQAEMAGMPVHKDYPEQGYSWRQLKAPELTPERIKYIEQNYPELNAEHGLEYANSRELQKWLTQEGDAMGHCVGGYCDDVISGASNIYSLRDAKGQPHVTIETSPVDALPEHLNLATDLAHEAAIAKGLERYSDAYFDYTMGIERDMLAKARKMLPADTREASRIVQIKGKGNAKPKDEYLPFVQDFVRSGKWSEIEDAANTGLTPEEIQQLLKGQ